LHRWATTTTITAITIATITTTTIATTITIAARSVPACQRSKLHIQSWTRQS
jgi:hypothetical protein